MTPATSRSNADMKMENEMTDTGKINAVLEHFRDGATAPGMDTVLEVLDFARIGAAVRPRPISEAPKDETLILAKDHESDYYVAWWDKTHCCLDNPGWTDGIMSDHRYEEYAARNPATFILLSALPQVKP